MKSTEKKIAAALAAVTAYIQAEEEALVMQPPEKLTLRKFIHGKMWGISGRQDLMHMRHMMHMKVFNR